MQLSPPSPKLRFAALSLLFTYLFFFEYLPPFSLVHIPYDLGGYHYSLFEYTFRALKLGHFPEWDPTIYSGMGLAANIQAELFYPPAWLLFAANVRRAQMSFASLEIFVIAHVWLAFMLCYAWLRGRRLRPLACALGAGAFAFGGYTCLQLQHLGLIAGYAWFPLGFLGIDQAVRRRDWVPLWKVVAASALCLLAGYPPTWFVFVVCLAVYAVASSWHPRIILGTAVSLAISLAVCAIQLLPASESSALMMRENRYGAGIKNADFYLSYFLPNYFDFGLNVPIRTNPGKEYLYLGAPVLLGILLLRRRKLRDVLPFLAILAAGLIFVTNPYNLVWDAVKHSSLLSELCRDWYFLAAIPLAAAALAAYGLSDFLDAPTRPISRWWTVLSLAILVAWSAWELRNWFSGGPFAYGIRAIYAPSITLMVLAFALYAARSRKGAWRIALAVAILLATGIDYKVFGTSKRFNAESGSGQPPFAPSHFIEIEPDVYTQLKAHAEYRILLEGGPHPLELRQVGLMTPQGFDPFLPEQYRELLAGKAVFRTSREFDIDPERKDVLHLFGIRYVITAAEFPVYQRLLGEPDFRLLGKGISYYRVFEYLHATPPFGWEHPSAGDHARLLSWTPERRDFQVQSVSGGRFVFEEQRLPGWEASVDGRASPVERWNLAFQSVMVPPGDHNVQFRFRSKALRRGALISALTLFAVGAAAFAGRTRSRRIG
jgi:hypothetical protein